MKFAGVKVLLVSLLAMFSTLDEAIACSCGPFVIPTPCELIAAVDTSAAQDFVAIVDLIFVEELDYSRTFRIDVVDVLGGISIPSGTLFEGFQGSLCGTFLATNAHRGLLVGKINSEGRVVPSACQPEDSFFPILNGEVVIGAYNGIPEQRYPLSGIRTDDCSASDSAQSLYYIEYHSPNEKLLEIRSVKPFSGPATVTVINTSGQAVRQEIPLQPFSTNELPLGYYVAIIRDEDGVYSLPFMVQK
ncbi:MAG: T9SS type A sorting domain-containing protein [Saprospiraceae bacterium]